MKTKLILFLALLALCGSGVRAIEVNIVNQSSGANGSFTTANYVFESNASSGLAGVTISSRNSDIIIGSSNVTSYGGYCFSFTTPVNQTDYTVDFSAPSGYLITSIYMRLRSNQGSYPIRVSTSNGTVLATSNTLGVDCNLANVNAQTTSLVFYCTTNDNGTN